MISDGQAVIAEASPTILWRIGFWSRRDTYQRGTRVNSINICIESHGDLRQKYLQIFQSKGSPLTSISILAQHLPNWFWMVLAFQDFPLIYQEHSYFSCPLDLPFTSFIQQLHSLLPCWTQRSLSRRMVAIFVGTSLKPLRWRMEVIQKQPKRDLAHGRSQGWSLVQRALKHLKVGQVETPCLILVNLTGRF